MILISLVLLGVYLYFAFVKLNPNTSLSDQWNNYINPLNQVFLFLGGFLIGHFLRNIVIKKSIIFTLIIIAFSLFTFYPSSGDSISIVTGINRLVFTACCFLICACFYKLTFQFPKFIHQPLKLLGEASYSVYLIHPIVWTTTGMISEVFSQNVFYIPHSIRFSFSIVFTLSISYFVYQYFEKFFMKLGRKNSPGNVKE